MIKLLCYFFEEERISAPAPSPNKTHVLLSSQSIILESVSAPINKIFLYLPDLINESTIWMPYINQNTQPEYQKKEYFEFEKNPVLFVAVEGKVLSGVVVAIIMHSISFGSILTNQKHL